MGRCFAHIILATAHLVKGLEFDEVIIPNVDCNNYRTSIDRQLLYVGCTRAMHFLRLTHTGEPSRLFLIFWGMSVQPVLDGGHFACRDSSSVLILPADFT